MELVFLERQNGCRDESSPPEFSGRSEEDRHLPVTASELRSESSQTGCKLPLSSDEKQSKSCQSCRKAPCSCTGELPHSDEYPTFPSKMMILDLLIGSLRHPRRTHNISDLDDLVSESSAGNSTASLTLSPSEKLVLDSIHAFVNTRTLPKSPSFFLPGAKMRKIRSRSHIRTQTQILKMISTETCDTSLPGASPFSMHEKMFLSCSSTASMSSNQSASSYHSLTAGLLHCTWKDGLPHLEFSVDDPVGVYTARPIKVQSAGDKALDYIYLFHSVEHGRKDWMGNSSNASRLAGKMKVSSSLILNSGKPSFMETGFVLFGSSDDYLRQTQSSSSVTKGKGLAKRVAEMIRPGHYSSSPKHARKFAKSCSQQFDNTSETAEGELSSAKESGPANLLADDFLTSHELAAIVVREYRRERQKEPVVGGWGLKFLEKAGATHSDSSEDTDVQNRKDTARDINVVVPRGYHGGPVTQNSGPSSLLQRWKSGGHCDCGGWDLGCPIRVLNNGGNPLPRAMPQDCRSVDLLEGVENGEPLMRLVNITEDLHIIYFESSFSPLQCFSTGIAIIHSQTSELYPKL